ncbi:ribose pyranase, partial [Lactococcus cremoris subsp. cremoris TIFN5]
RFILLTRIKENNPEQLKILLTKLSADVEVVFVSHETLKLMNHDVKAVVRTGENTTYSNIILQSGVAL